MGLSWNDRRRERRVKPGDGKPLRPFRWWQLTRRSLLSIVLPVGDGGGLSATYTVEVKHGGDAETGVVRARLYRDGFCEAESKLPARFPVPGGRIEVRRSEVGLRRCHFVADGGGETRLTPDPRSGEGRRMNFAREHPGASALVGAVSVLLLLIGVGLNLLQAAQPISEIPPVAESLGTFESPLRLPVWLNVTLGVGAVLGATERAMRMRYHWLLDGGAGT
ncbi:hypothetical protein [Streptomyces sp. NPDC006855]|uniref:hypothetical protein n=1 Tax=Streptomyces sp. NPDC006855 TaxID=3364765 RepID=UPI00367B5078